MILGLHISTAGDLLGTPKRARDMGADAIQIFAGSPRTWRPSVYTPEQGERFKAACKEAGIEAAFIHMLYLVSYGAADEELRSKSITAIENMLKTADLLGVRGVITHLGSHKGLGIEQALERLCSAIKVGLDASKNSFLILENSAGAGGNIGNSIEELSMIIKGLDNHPRVKVCLDTCHLFGAGYDIRTKEGLNDLLQRFDKLIGLDRLVAMHLNDSKGELGNRLDRHQNIGDGSIGNDGFRAIVNDSRLEDVPGLLEVPGLDGNGPDAANLKRLRDLIA